VGIGLQLVFIGGTKTAAVETEAGVQLVGLACFAWHIESCTLTIVAPSDTAANRDAEAGLDIVTRAGKLLHVGPCTHPDQEEAVRRVFELATVELARWPEQAQ
jgi:hypothetical protein